MDDFNMDQDINGESMTLRSVMSNKELLSYSIKATCTDKDKDYNDLYSDPSAAFLGPQIWEKTSMPEFKMDFLVDLDSLLNEAPQKNPENNEVNNEKVPHHVHHHQQHQQQPPLHHQQQPHHHQQQQPHLHQHQHHHVPTQDIHNLVPVQSPRRMISQPSSPVDSSSLSEMENARDPRFAVDCKFSPTDLALATPPGQEHYDPASTVFPDEELKPQPIIKKSRKNFVPDNLKDDKYWARRHKNNIAAKRSREARRLKENQIVLRASYLEKENNSLKEDVMRLKAENDMLRSQLKEFQS